MRPAVGVLCVCLLAAPCLPQPHVLRPLDALLIGPFRFYRRQLLNFFGRTSEDPEVLRAARDLKKLQEHVPPHVRFPCPGPGRSSRRPSSVHRLRPGDVDVVGAIGDSLTAGYGLVSVGLFQALIENRGLSWSAGGQGTWRRYLTIPNILREFNPHVIGYSIRDSYNTDRSTWFNAAESGAISTDLRLQVRNLVARMRSDHRVNVENDWKLVTSWVGTNDICLFSCLKKRPEDTIEIYRQDMLYVLRYLRDNLPRTLVNLVPVHNLRALAEIRNPPSLCQFTLQFTCPCLFVHSTTLESERRRAYSVIRQWQRVAKELADMLEFQRDDFTIVYQPFSAGYNIPLDKTGNTTDYSYLAPDCFHFSQKTTAEFANGLWNNMLEPVGYKTPRYSRLFNRFLCPSLDYPYIFTRENSQSYQRLAAVSAKNALSKNTIN